MRSLLILILAGWLASCEPDYDFAQYDLESPFNDVAPSPAEAPAARDVDPETSAMMEDLKKQVTAGDFSQAYVIYKRIADRTRDRYGDEGSLRDASSHALAAEFALRASNPARAVEHAEAAQEIYIQQTGNASKATIDATISHAAALVLAGDYQKAKSVLRAQIAKIRQEKGAHAIELIQLTHQLAVAEKETSNFSRARQLYNEVIEIKKVNGLHEDVSMTTSLQNLASLYFLEGRYSEAEEIYDKALDILDKATGGSDDLRKAILLQNMGGTAAARQDHELAERLFSEALKIKRAIDEDEFSELKVPRQKSIATTLMNLGRAFQDQGKLQQAEGLYQEAEGLFALNRNDPGFYHRGMLAQYRAEIGMSKGALDEARSHWYMAIKTMADIRGFDSHDTALMLSGYAAYLRLVAERQMQQTGARSVPHEAAAIFIAKLAKNALAPGKMRMDSGDELAAASFQSRKAVAVEPLQQWLADARRHQEAELVGRLSKSDLAEVGIDGAARERIPLTPMEREWAARLMQFAGPGTTATASSFSKGWDAWLADAVRLPESVFDQDVAAVSSGLQAGLSEMLKRQGARVAALQVASFESQTHFYVVTSDGEFVHAAIDVGEREIGETIARARDELGLFDPARTSRTQRSFVVEGESREVVDATLGELYRVLLLPVEPILQARGIETVLLNLHGRVQYAPYAALFDGEKYAIEKFDLVRMAGAVAANDQPVKFSSGVGFGTSKAYRGFAPLPGVRTELESIFSGEGRAGVVDGAVYLDETFTRTALETALSRGFSIVHIASHFDMLAGDPKSSYLLLGDGSHLSLREIIGSQRFMFEGVDLLVLSACSTGRSTEGTGVEVEGLGSIATLRGARSVLATLWNVSDASTAELMTDFYTRLSRGEISKARALRDSQRELIASRGRSTDYSHPYYWAPYILLGDGR